MSVSDTTRSFIQAVIDGETDAWETIVDLYHPLVLRWCQQAGLQYADALDVSQEVFRGVSKSIYTYQFGIYRFRNWLKGIARNKIRDHYRMMAETDVAKGGMDAQCNNLAVTGQFPDDDQEDDEQDSSILLIQALEMIKKTIDPKSWNMAWDVVILGEKVQEVAKKNNVSPSAVYKAKTRVLARIRSELHELIE